MKQPLDVTIELVEVATQEVVALLGELDGALAGPYSKEQRHALPVDRLFQPDIRFFVARIAGEAIACGGVAFLGDYAELKRMYTKPAVRGRGVASALIARLEAETRQAGIAVLRIETGVYQRDAIKFYETAGFKRRGPFGSYADMPLTAIATSVFYERLI